MNGLKLLLWKNLKVQSRNRVTLAAEIFVPALIILSYGYLHVLMKVKEHPDPIIYDTFKPTDVPRVLAQDTNVIYYGPSNPLTDSIMDIVDRSHFKARGLNYTFRRASNMRELVAEYTRERTEWNCNLTRGPILGAIYFDNMNWGVLPKDVQYTIRLPSAQRTFYLGFTDRGGLKPSWQTEYDHMYLRIYGPRAWKSSQGGFPGYFDEGFLYLQQALDAAILQKLLVNASDLEGLGKLELNLGRFPFREFQEDKYDFVITLWTQFTLVAVYAFPVMNLTRQIIQEKSSRLKEFLKIMGLKSWLHWLAWFVQSYSTFLISSLLMALASKVSLGGNGLSFLKYSSNSLFFVLLSSYAFLAVGFSFMASTLFSTAESGATATGFAWIMLMFPCLQFYFAFEERSNLLKYLSCLFGGSTPMGLAWDYVGEFERQGVGIQWDNLWDGATSKDDMSLGILIIIMFVTGLAYMLAAFYIELAFPGQFGVRLPWYFPLTLWYWTGSGDPTEKTRSVGAGKSPPAANFEADPQYLAVGVELKGLTKVFATRVAVNNLNFKMYQNQVTSLLGHNGAGKTTTMSMLTGLIRPSTGTAYIEGFDIRNEMGRIRRSLGLCPQNNILFDSLTVEEHLKFYCALKGMEKAEAMDEIQRCLRLLGLENQRGTLGKNLSAGTKRKLCVGMAFSAGSKLVLLDEPTAGMDPIGRRSTWEIIQSEKVGRTVILSTHYMEEADILGDRIAIMADGQLQCCGSSVFLKRKYGQGFKLTIVKEDYASAENIKDMITKSVPKATFTDESGQEIKCRLPAKTDGSFCPLFEDLEASRSDLGIITYGVTPSTMEEVFVRVGEDHEKVSKNVQKSKEDLTGSLPDSNPERHLGGMMADSTRQLHRPDSFDWNEGCQLWWQQMKAMLVKRVHMNTRRLSLLCLQLLMPASLVIVCQFLQEKIPGMFQPKARLMSLGQYKDFGEARIILNCDPALEIICDSVRNTYGDSAVFEQLGPHSLPLTAYLVEKTKGSLWKVESDYLFALEAKDMGMMIGENATTAIHGNITMLFNNQFFHLPPLGLNILTNSLLHRLGNEHTISVVNHPFDYSHQEEAFSFPGFADAFFVAFSVMSGLAFLAASLVISPTVERLSQFKHLQIIAGVRLPIFWTAEILCSSVIFLVGVVMVLLSTDFIVTSELKSFEMKFRCLLLGLAYGAAFIPLAMLVSTYASSAAKAYSQLLALTYVSSSASMFSYVALNNPEFELEDYARPFHHTLLLMPPYNVGMGVFMLAMNYDATLGCKDANLRSLCERAPQSLCCTKYRESYWAWDGFGAGKNVVYLLGIGAISLLLLILREAKIIPKIQLAIYKMCCLKQKPESPFTVELELKDSDVTAESRRVTHSTLSTLSFTDPLVFRKLTKVLSGRPVVNGLSFGVHKGEVFGLLGVNGSGKTTTFRMLTQNTTISSGDAFISSYSVLNQTRRAHRHLGYCPQSDAFIMELTGREALTMFARLKGMKEHNIPELIQDVSSKLLFSRYLDKQIGTYSGGNKRKLSAAVAMLGYPEVVIFDEPTAGIDPVAKFHVWEAVAAVRNSGTSVIIASQDMDECEALCSRIGIMSDGQLRCIGTPQYLKSRLNSGYKLVVQLSCSTTTGEVDNNVPGGWDVHSSWRSQKEEFGKFMKSRLPGCILKEDHVGLLEYSLPAQGITWSGIFAAMEDAAFASQIEGFCVGQAGLRDVFFRYGQES